MKLEFTRNELIELLNNLQELNQHFSILKSCYKKNEYLSRNEKDKKAYEMQEKINNTNKLIYKVTDAIACPFE